jgi:rhodanese-related sulfurtransferase
MSFRGTISHMSDSQQSSVPIEITFDDFQSSFNPEALLLDCRTAEEHDDGHLDGAVLFPLQQLSVRVSDLDKYRTTCVFVYCKSGNRSLTFARYLRTLGFFKCQSILGGYETWGETNHKC